MESSLIKCSNEKCKQVFMIDDNRIPGGINDKYYVTIRCKSCGALTHDILYNVDHGWQTKDYEIVEYEEIFGNTPYSLLSSGVAKVSGAEDINKSLHAWCPTVKSPLWQGNGINHEIVADRKFSSVKDILEESLNNWDHGRLKSKTYADFSKLFVRHTYKDKGKIGKAIWYKEVGENEIKGTDGFYLIHHNKSDWMVDGIYSRDESLVFLERLLVRWNALCSEVIVATPFIGYDFSFSKLKDREELIAMWKLLNGLLNMEKTIFFTRPTTYSSLKKNQCIVEKIPADVRAEWNLMSNLQKIVHNPKTRAKMKKNFHLKIYVGVFEDHVELFSGSFNVQKNTTLENMSLRILRKDDFKNHYMDVMVDRYKFREPLEEKVLFVDIQGNQIRTNTIQSIDEINNMIGRVK